MKKKVVISVSIAVVLIALVLCAFVVPAKIQQRRDYTLLESYVAQHFSTVVSVRPTKGVTDCYGNGKSSCPAVTYVLTESKCMQVMRMVNATATTCDYQATATYQGHTIHNRVDQTSPSGSNLIVWLTD